MSYCDKCAQERNYPMRPLPAKWMACDICGKRTICSYSPLEVIRARDELRAAHP